MASTATAASSAPVSMITPVAGSSARSVRNTCRPSPSGKPRSKRTKVGGWSRAALKQACAPGTWRTWKPWRSSAFWVSRAWPGSSSTKSMLSVAWPMRLTEIIRREFDHLDKHPKLHDAIDEGLHADRLHDVAVGPQLVGAINFSLIVGGGQHDYGNLHQQRIALQVIQDFEAIHARHAPIQKDNTGQRVRIRVLIDPGSGHVVDGFLPVTDAHQAVCNAAPP